jgi:hypothetical protein
MTAMEASLTDMHHTLNSMHEKRLQIESLLATLKDEKYRPLVAEGTQLAAKMKAWDETMVQRKTKVYDDSDNFRLGFTANYLFLINQVESDIPMVTQPALDRKKELDSQWAGLKATSTSILEKELPAFNKKCWEAGIGALWK